MNSETQLWLFAMSVGASALGGMLGMASGIFIVPILTIFGHIDIRSVIGAILWAESSRITPKRHFPPAHR
jgi:uncharacterized protein